MSANDQKPNGGGRCDRLPKTLVSEHQWLRTVAFARLGRWEAVDDVIQEVAVAATRQQELDGQANANGWLYRVTVRQALLYRRRQGRRSKREESNGHDTSINSHGREVDPLASVLAAEEAEFVHQAIQRLQPRDRELLLLKYTEDWTCQQLAEHLGCGISAVESRLFRARNRLRILLTQYEHDTLAVVREESTNP